MSFTLTTTLSLYKPDFGHTGWYALYNANFDVLDARFGVASFTSGSVVFADGAGKLSQDNVNLNYASNLLTLGRTVGASGFHLQRFQRSGVTKGALGLDANDWFVIRGANLSDAIKISSTDQIVFGDAGVSAPLTRFRFGDDLQINGVLRIGADATFGALPVDPDGGIQLGRDIPAQDHGVIRFYRQGAERARIGLDASDRISLKQGASDVNGLVVGAGVVVGIPTGGDKGSGTINAQAVYDDNVLLTDYVFEPGYNLVCIQDMKKFYEEHKHLPTIKGRAVWEQEGKFSLGALVNMLWETVEVQARYCAELNDRVAALEVGTHGEQARLAS